MRLFKLPILSLQMLVYTPKGNVPVVGNYLKQCNLFLGEPSLSYGMQRLANYHYFNPHTPSGGRDDIIMAFNSLTSPERDHSRWTTPIINGKNIDVQRSQVDELFKSLKDEDGLVETEPCTFRGSYRCLTDTYVLAVGFFFLFFWFVIVKKRLRGGDTAISSSKESYHFPTGTRAGKRQRRKWLLFSMAAPL